ncbi:hypothetical protein VT85_26345 (plasmid) [Planctomyces sp. SH-PL62]|nr:hypothetical protein VT85_23775 [Planctomyces sp. SH-PL62]AMV40983.1 hypothetical protein VT85_26345 [Planctomyces sp. SH-PL62]
MGRIEDCDLWWFRELYSILAAFADAPENTIARIGGGVSVPDDQAEDLDHFRGCILAKYPDARDLAVMKVVEEVDAILERRSLGGEAFEEGFWTNQGFREHPDWKAIRGRARSFLLR